MKLLSTCRVLSLQVTSLFTSQSFTLWRISLRPQWTLQNSSKSKPISSKIPHGLDSLGSLSAAYPEAYPKSYPCLSLSAAFAYSFVRFWSREASGLHQGSNCSRFSEPCLVDTLSWWTKSYVHSRTFYLVSTAPKLMNRVLSNPSQPTAEPEDQVGRRANWPKLSAKTCKSRCRTRVILASKTCLGTSWCRKCRILMTCDHKACKERVFKECGRIWSACIHVLES